MSQIINKEMKGSHRRAHGVDWPDDKPTTEDEDDNIAPDGTDYVAKAQGEFDRGEESEGSRVAEMLKRLKEKRGEKGMEAEEDEREDDDDMGKAQGYAAREDESLGMREGKESGKKQDEKARRDDSYGKWGDRDEEDEDEGGKEEKRELMGKSFFDYVEVSPVLMEGVNQSAFLQEMVKSVGFSFAKLEDNLGYVFANVHNDYVDFAKGIDGTFEELGKSLGMIDTAGADVDGYTAQGNVDVAGATPLRKSGFGESEVTKTDILGALMKGFEAGQVSPTDIIKFETTGTLSHTLQKSLGL